MTGRHWRHAITLAGLGPIAFLPAGLAHAEAGGGAIPEIIVAATRAPGALADYPGSVSLIDRGEIEDLMPSSVSDLFEDVPGVRFTGGPRRTGETPSIRGIDGEGVGVLFDGVRQSFLSGHDGRFFIEPDLLAAVEIVRGPSSALYGSGALGGVLAFRTLDAEDLLAPGERAGGHVKTGYQGVNDEVMAGGAAYARSPDDRLQGLASLTLRASDDIALANGFDLPADDRTLSGLLKGSYALSPALEASLSWIGFLGRSEEPNNGQGASVGDLVDKTISSHTVRAGVIFDPKANDLVDAELIGVLGRTGVDEDEIDSARSIGRTIETLGLIADNRSRVDVAGGSLTFTYGADLFRDTQDGTDSAAPDGERGGVPDAETLTYGLFGQAELVLATGIGEIRLLPALRYDRFATERAGAADSAEDGALSPKIGVLYRPIQVARIFVNYAEAYRAPSFNELFADGVHFPVVLGPGLVAENSFIANPELRPERSATWETGLGLDAEDVLAPGDRLTGSLSAFRSEVSDLIDLDVDFSLSPSCFGPMIPGPCTAGTTRYVNRVSARIEGIEAEFAYESRHVFASAAWSAIDGEDTATGEPVGSLGPDRINFGVGVNLPARDLRLGLRAETGSRFTRVSDPAEERPAYTLLDIHAAWEPSRGALEGLRLDLGIDNLLDADAERVFAGVSEPGRNVKAAIRWRAAF
ncbi:MAG: TonB-dependent receptor [Alphaproteobacteria bacterium]|nr:TonB-dependent receptor [Alphaproteobacteria bacterium]